MKRNFGWSFVCVTAILIIGTGVAHATTLLGSMSFNPYIGMEYQYQHIKANRDWTKVMPASFQNGAIFLGNKYHKHFGIELGYYQNYKKSYRLRSVNSFDGVVADAPNAEVTTRLRLKGFSLEWDVYWPLDPNFNLIFISSLVTVHPDITIQSTGSGSDLATALTKVKGRNRTILRLGLGTEYVEKHWGARGRVLWDHTQHLHLEVNDAQAAYQSLTAKVFKQAITVTVGLFFRF